MMMRRLEKFPHAIILSTAERYERAALGIRVRGDDASDAGGIGDGGDQGGCSDHFLGRVGVCFNGIAYNFGCLVGSVGFPCRL